MLHAIRRFVKSWVAKLLLGLLILSFAVWGIEGVFSGSTNPTIARVGTEPIDAERFIDAVLRQQNQLTRQRQAVVSLQELRDDGIDEMALQALIRDANFASELKSLELAVPVEAVRENIRSNPVFHDGQGQFSQFTYQSRLSQEGFDPIEFERLTRSLLGQQILVDATGNADAYAPGAAEAMAKWRGETRGIRMITLPISSADDPADPTDSQLQEYFSANGDAFIEPDRIWGRFLHTDVAHLVGQLEPTDAELRSTYDDAPDRYTVDPTRTIEQVNFPDMAAAQAAADRISEGTATFAEIAEEQEIGADALSLGTVGQDELPEATATAAFEATEPGVVGPIEGPFNVLLLNITGVGLGGLQAFDDVKGLIRQQVLQERLRARIPELANQVDDIRASGASLQEIAEKTRLPLREFAGIAANLTVAEGTFPPAAYDQRLMAEITDASEGEERDMVELADGSYALVMVDRIVDSHLPELDAIKPKVIEAWKNEQRLAALEARALGLMAGENGGDVDAAATATGLEVVEPEAFSRESPPPTLSGPLVESIFSGAEGGFVSGRNQLGTGVVLARIETITPLDAETLAEQKTELETALHNSVARDHLEYFSRALSETHDVSINRDAIETIFERMGQASGQGY